MTRLSPPHPSGDVFDLNQTSMQTPPRWVILSPVIPPAAGGAARYTKLLAEGLADSGRKVTVISENHPEHRSVSWAGGIDVRPIFPHRAGRVEIDSKAYVLYALQNVKMLGLASEIEAIAKEDGIAPVVLVHSSFFYKPSVMPRVISRLRKALGPDVRLVVDVRDPLSTPSAIRHYHLFDSIVCCSLLIQKELSRDSALAPKTVHIPIPFDPDPAPDLATCKEVLSKFGLQEGRFLFNPNGVARAKGFDEMLAAVVELRKRPGYEDVCLVTAGRKRDWIEADDAAVTDGSLVYTGSVDHRTFLALAKSSLMGIIVSRIEGLPRASLEILAVGNRLVLPPVLEFEEGAAAWVARDLDPVVLADQIQQLDSSAPPLSYDVGQHATEALVPQYMALEP